MNVKNFTQQQFVVNSVFISVKMAGSCFRKGNQSITKTALKWTPADGQRSRGRPRETWRRTIEGDLKKMGKTWKEVEKIAAARNKWRGLVSTLCVTGCD